MQAMRSALRRFFTVVRALILTTMAILSILAVIAWQHTNLPERSTRAGCTGIRGSSSGDFFGLDCTVETTTYFENRKPIPIDVPQVVDRV